MPTIDSDDQLLSASFGDDDALLSKAFGSMQRPAPALTYAGVEQGKHAVLTGSAGLQDLVESTRGELEREHGPGNVRPVIAAGNRFVDFEVRQGNKWVSSGARGYYNEIAQALQQKLLSEADTDHGLPWGVRAEANIKTTPEGMRSNLAARYGDGNVFQLLGPDGSPGRNFIVRESPTSKPRIFDSERMSWAEFGKDLTADMLGDVIEATPGIAGGLLGAELGARSPIGPAAGAQTGSVLGDVVGSAVRQGISGALPGSDQLTPSQRLQAAGTNVSAGAAGEGIGRAAGAAWSAISPWKNAERVQGYVLRHEAVPTSVEETTALTRQTLGSKIKQAVGIEKQPEILANIKRAPHIAEENKALFEGTGINPTPGQLTGSRTQIRFENWLRQIPGSENIWAAHDMGQLIANGRFLDRTLAAMGEDVGADEACRRIVAAGDKFIEGLAGKRGDIAGKLFSEVDQASGHQRLVPLTNTMAAIDTLIDRHQRLLGMNTSDIAVKGLLERKDKLIKGAGGDANDVRATMRELQNELHEYGYAARGKGSVIKDLDKASDTEVARTIFKALNQDLDAAASRAETGGVVAKKLRTARNSWAAWTQAINDANDTLIEKATGLNLQNQPHKLASALLGKEFSDEQVRAAMLRLAKMPGGKEAAANIRVAALQGLIEEASPQATSMSGVRMAQSIARGEDVGAIVSPSKLATRLLNRRRRFAALFADDPAGFGALNKIAAIQSILGDTGGMAGSQTGAFGLFRDVLRSLSKAEIKEATTTLNMLMNSRRFSIICTDPVQRDIFIGLAKPQRDLSPQQVKRTIAKLWALNQRANGLFEERQGEEDER